jgi:hypothetical protein
LAKNGYPESLCFMNWLKQKPRCRRAPRLASINYRGGADALRGGLTKNNRELAAGQRILKERKGLCARALVRFGMGLGCMKG